MFILLFMLFWFIGLLVGSFGWVQIIGSVRYARQRGTILTAFTITLWTIILSVLTIVCFLFFNEWFYGYCIGLFISFILSIKQKEFE